MNTGNDIRNSLKKMRDAQQGKQYTPKSEQQLSETKHMTMREMLGRMRSIKEDDLPQEKTTTPLDRRREEQKLEQNFDDLEVTPKIEDFEVYDNGVFMSGSIDDQITFTFSVSPSEDDSGIEWTAAEGFNAEDPENQKVVERLETYYGEFYKYWRDNELQL